MATVMGAAPHVSSVGVGVVETSSRKTVRLSVDSGAPDNVAETALPSLTVSAPTATVETTRAAMERAASASEIEPTLLLAATIFVQELTENAKIEADRRLHPPSETQALLAESEESSSARTDSGRNEGLGTDGARNRRTNLGGQPAAAPASADGNLRFIREEINKKCRRVYRAFITCYQKLP